MGNSIFVAAYLIMVLPLALYRLINSGNTALRLREHRAHSGDANAPPVATSGEVTHMIARLLIVVGGLALLLAVIKFGAAIRTSDFRYWWVFPGAVTVATALWATLGYRPTSEQKPFIIWPGALFGGFIMFFALQYMASSSVQQVNEAMTNALDWGLWLFISIFAISIAYALTIFGPRPAPEPSRISAWLTAAGTGVLVLILGTAIIFSQSRGPWIGMGAGLFVFLVLVLWQAARRARQQGNTTLATRLRWAFGGWIALVLVAGGFLIAFNLSDAPVFEPLRDMPYIGRMGELLEVDAGTGRVRILIWAGDEHAGGALALISADPMRALLGWGPESMFVAYNPFYPPDLGQIESRGASPDRSHQAILDELVTKGLLGLASYLFVLISFFVLAWQQMRRSQEWHWQVFFIACMSAITAHFVEGLTGIPIVSSLTMFWVILGITVCGGMIAGHYVIGSTAPLPDTAPPEPSDAETPAATTPDASPKGKGKKGKRGRRATAGRGAAARRAPAAPSRPLNPLAIALYGIVVVLTLGAVWWFNLSTIYADMRFSEAQSISNQSQQFNGQVEALSRYIDTVRSNPREDFYYLNLGRSLMTTGEMLRQMGTPLGQPDPDASVSDLLRLENASQVATFVQESSPQQMLSYAEATLQDARELNELNKDHYANLARLHNFWFNWEQNVDHLYESVEWYERANAVAPQDVVLLNERASTTMLLANHLEQTGDAQGSAEYMAQAEEVLQRAAMLDETYVATFTRLGDLYQMQGQLEDAVAAYVTVIERNPGELNDSLDGILSVVSREQPALLTDLYDAYLASAEQRENANLYATAGRIAVLQENLADATTAYQQAVELAPEQVQNRLNYSLVLSNTEDFAAALTEAETGLQLAREQADAQEVRARFEQLIAYLENRVAGGE
jgi:tetratricopeptide (TPR) repeat protein/O-antigen ligase